jgi:Fe2+ or Zn2+ uptake regulation protein
MEKKRATRQKQLIADILRQAETPLTATELYSRAFARCPTLAKSTVYRNLEAMVQRGELERGFLENGESFFVVAQQGHHHYMICRECNRMQHLPACPMAHLQEELTSDSGFVPVEHVVQIYGYCRECARKHETN